MADPLMLTAFERVTGAELKQLQKLCMQLMQQDDAPVKFPGAQPVSFERRHLTTPEPGRMHASLVASPYFAAEKTDGVRYMLLILGSKGTFTVDRNFEMRRMPPMRFPSRQDASVPLDATLLDGELIAERGGTGRPVSDAPAAAKKRPREEEGDGAGCSDATPSSDSAATTGPSSEGASSTATRLRFLAYDACRVASKACCDVPLRERLMALRRDVLGPRYKLAASEPSTFDGEPFTVELKDFFELEQLPHIFSQVQTAPPGSDGMLYAFNDPLRKLSHGNDGIIFTPARDPYRPYTCPSLLKWKPANMNSVDFKLQTKWRREGDSNKPKPRFYLCVASQTSLEPFSWITFNERDFARFASDPAADTRIVECVYDPSWHTVEYDPVDDRERTWDHPRTVPGGWRFERIREDKRLPNDKSTVSSIYSSVRDGVTAPELLHTLNIRVPAAALTGAFAPPPAPPPAEAHGAEPASTSAEDASQQQAAADAPPLAPPEDLN